MKMCFAWGVYGDGVLGGGVDEGHTAAAIDTRGCAALGPQGALATYLHDGELARLDEAEVGAEGHPLANGHERVVLESVSLVVRDLAVLVVEGADGRHVGLEDEGRLLYVAEALRVGERMRG